MVANRRDCGSTYVMKCSLEVRHDTSLLSQFHSDNPNGGQRELRNEYKDDNGCWVGATITTRFYQGQAEGWHLVEHVFKEYPAGMRYLALDCVGGGDRKNTRGLYGLKLANCSMKALLEKNAAK